MGPGLLIADLERRGVRLVAEGPRLRYRAPRGVLTEDDLSTLARWKGEILAALANAGAPAERTRDPGPPSLTAGRATRRAPAVGRDRPREIEPPGPGVPRRLAIPSRPEGSHNSQYRRRPSPRPPAPAGEREPIGAPPLFPDRPLWALVARRTGSIRIEPVAATPLPAGTIAWCQEGDPTWTRLPEPVPHPAAPSAARVARRGTAPTPLFGPPSPAPDRDGDHGRGSERDAGTPRPRPPPTGRESTMRTGVPAGSARRERPPASIAPGVRRRLKSESFLLSFFILIRSIYHLFI